MTSKDNWYGVESIWASLGQLVWNDIQEQFHMESEIGMGWNSFGTQKNNWFEIIPLQFNRESNQLYLPWNVKETVWMECDPTGLLHLLYNF